MRQLALVLLLAAGCGAEMEARPVAEAPAVVATVATTTRECSDEARGGAA